METEPSVLRIAGIVRQSIVDGPGLRLVVFTQGCPHSCSGCHNPDTHDFAGGYDCELSRILAAYDKNPLLCGVTLSGGEPFAQPEGLIPLAEAIHTRGGNIWCYSGYTLEELLAMENPAVRSLLALCDVLIDGRFILEEKDLTLRFRGSRNQRLLDVSASLQQEAAVLLPE